MNREDAHTAITEFVLNRLPEQTNTDRVLEELDDLLNVALAELE